MRNQLTPLMRVQTQEREKAVTIPFSNAGWWIGEGG